MTNTNLQELEANLGYSFKHPELLQTALIHRSFLNESNTSASNERLEFLGDAVLELIVSEFLFQTLPEAPEGILTAARAAIVRTESLAQIAVQLKLGDFLNLSHGEEKSGGRTNVSLLANTFEAVLGAIYLDGGLSVCQQYLQTHLVPYAQTAIQGNLKDPKSTLQEKVQELGYPSPTYETVSQLGPDHDKKFEVAVFADNIKLATGTGRNKQTAQQAAAASALENLPPKLL